MTLTERLRKRMTRYLIEEHTNVKAMHKRMDCSFSYETLRNFNNRATTARGYVINEIDEFLTQKGY